MELLLVYFYYLPGYIYKIYNNIGNNIGNNKCESLLNQNQRKILNSKENRYLIFFRAAPD